MKIRVRDLKRLLHEQMLAEDGASNLGKLLDELGALFTTKMQAQFPQAEDVIRSEAIELKTQCTAQIRAAAAKVKMTAGEARGAGGEKKLGFKEPPRERFTGQI